MASMYIGEALELLFKEIRTLSHKVDMLVEKEAENNIEEISLYKATKILHKGSEAIIKLVETKQLKAITYKDSSGKKRYRFRMCDIHKYQNKGLYNPDNVKPAGTSVKRVKEVPEELRGASEKLAKKIFGLK